MRTFTFAEIDKAPLIVDALYRGGLSGHAGDDAIARLAPVGNQGGFRFRGPVAAPSVVALVTAGRQAAWPDELDPYTGVFTYYGDNRTPGHQLHESVRRGNQILSRVFALAHGGAEGRAAVPPFLLFAMTGEGRDTVFRGLAVPGVTGFSADEDLVAVWRTSSNGQRFQNYRAKFTVLDAAVVPRPWLREVASGNRDAPDAPSAWRAWVERGLRRPLLAPRSETVRAAVEQMPRSDADEELLRVIRARCERSSDFEHVAAEVWRLSTAVRMQIDVTRPSRDGGRDAVGAMYIGPLGDQIGLDFALEAKCYGPRNSVGVRDVSRLVSRLRHRQFGVLVTTSFLSPQAYGELREDGHPVVVLAGGDIVDVLRRNGLADRDALMAWMEGVIPSR